MPAMETITPLDPGPPELLQYLAPYKVVVCTSCHYAIQPSAISGHLNDIHQLHHSRRRPFMQFVSKLDLASPEVVLKTEILQFPVPGLSLQDGLICEDDGCKYLCASEKRMKSHWYSVHGRPGRVSVDWRPVPLQTFFKGNLLRYFTRSASDLPPDGYYCPLIQANPGSKKSNIHDLPVPFTSEALPRIILNDLDTLLFQHYIASTSLSLATDAETKILWQDTVPRLAYQHPLLLHGMLACAGLHLAYLYPGKEREYSIAARTHQDIAMPLFRSAIGKVNQDNCHACLVFSHLLVIYTWVSERQDERLLLVGADGEDILPPWLYFLRSGCSLFCHIWDDVETGPIKALALAWDLPVAPPKAKTDLVIRLLSALPAHSSPDAWLDEEYKIYHDSAVELGTAFAATPLSENYTTWDALRIWPMYASVDFFALLKSWHPGALILLAHYCILLQRVESNWYIEGRASRLLSTILHHLDSKWHQYIKWPLQEIGITPDTH